MIEVISVAIAAPIGPIKKTSNKLTMILLEMAIMDAWIIHEVFPLALGITP